MWSLLSVDLGPAQQTATIIISLEGLARDLARNPSWNDINHGGVVSGQHQDTVAYLLGQRAVHFAQLGEETRKAAMMDLQFNHLPHEG